MSEGPAGGQDSRREQEPARHAPETAGDSRAAEPGHDTYDLYRRGLDLLGRGSAAAAAQLLERAAVAEPNSRSVLEALARAQFDARQYAAAAGSFRRIVEASPSDDYAQFGLGLALTRTGDPRAAAEHLALAAAMRPDLRHYTDALRGVRATLRARADAPAEGRDAAWTEERATKERATREGGASSSPRGEREAEDTRTEDKAENPDDSQQMSGDD
jgi:tetratricopeptide (TPR) repeat protein